VNASFNSADFNSFILSESVIGIYESPITLKSGKQSNWYMNWRKVCSDVALIDRVSDFVLSYANDMDLDFDCIMGVPEGATKLGLLCHYKWAKSQADFLTKSYDYPMGRQSPKKHGHPDDKFFVGAPKGKILLIEDVATTGISMLGFIDRLEEAGKEISAAISLSNRMDTNHEGKSVESLMKERNIPYFFMSNGKELLRTLIESLDLNASLKSTLENELLT
tara:strand:- start:2295 stop:2957 length:663 start_codon:yes stop_codon:yes gene_type:complete